MGSSYRLTRRELLRRGVMTAGTAAAVPFVDGCGPDGDPNRLTLRTWSPDTRGRGAGFGEVVA